MTQRATVIDGSRVARDVNNALKVRVERLAQNGVRPGLGTILIGEDPRSQSYLVGKHRYRAAVGFESFRVELSASSATQKVLAAVEALSANPRCAALVVQSLLPRYVDTQARLEAMDPEKDADGLHSTNFRRLVLGQAGTPLCTPRGILNLLRWHDIPVTGAQYSGIGWRTTVSRPLGLMLARAIEHATVTMCHKATVDIAAHTQAPDVVIAAAGVAHLAQAEWVWPGARVTASGHYSGCRGHPRRFASRRRVRRWPLDESYWRRRTDDAGDGPAQRRRARRASREPGSYGSCPTLAG